MLVNLGGVRNFIVDIDENDDYVKMIENWALEFLRSSPGCRQITICSGLYSHQADNVSIDGRILRRCQLAHSTFVQHLRQADVYVTSPGLTALNEAIHVGKLPVLLPEQHFGQYYNLEQLRNTRLGNLSVRNSDLFSNYAITNDDYKGSLDVLKYIRRLREEEECRKRLHTILHQRITTVRNSSTEFRQAAIDEIKQLTQGADLKTVVTQILDDIRLGQ